MNRGTNYRMCGGITGLWLGRIKKASLKSRQRRGGSLSESEGEKGVGWILAGSIARRRDSGLEGQLGGT